MILVELSLVRETVPPGGLPFKSQMSVVAESVGAAVDAFAPDPALDAVITVQVLRKGVRVVPESTDAE
jgi:hypothetical protein